MRLIASLCTLRTEQLPIPHATLASRWPDLTFPSLDFHQRIPLSVSRFSHPCFLRSNDLSLLGALRFPRSDFPILTTGF
jgi:hypothetical protein